MKNTPKNKSCLSKGKRPGEETFWRAVMFATTKLSNYGLPGADWPVFGSVGTAALAAMGLEDSAP